MMEKMRRKSLVHVKLLMLLALVLILPATGAAQESENRPQTQETTPAMVLPAVDAAKDNPDDNKEKAKEDAAAPVHLDAIVVTGTRTENLIKELPASVSVLDSKEIETVKFVDATKELFKRIPGYSMIRNLRIPIGGKNYTINLVDGLAISAPFGSGTIGSPNDTNTFDIERIEVLKGPASALYGSNALGGVINVITRTPPLEPEYRVWGEAGPYDRSRGGISAAGSAGRLGYFIDANMLDFEGWQDRTVDEEKQVSAKLQFDMDPYSTLTVRSEYFDKYKENPGSITQAQYDDDWQQAEVYDAYNDEQSKSISAKYERDLSTQSSMELSYGIRNTVSEGPPSYSATGGFESSDVTNQNLVGVYQHNFDFYGSELIFGMDLQHSASDSTAYSERNTSSDIAQQWDVVAEVTSPFLQFEVSPTEKTRLSVGARYDNVRYSATGYKVSRGVTTDYDETADFSNLSPKAGITYNLSDDHTLWLSYGQGFVVPSRTYLFVGSRGYDPNPDLEPEKADSYEVGLRGKLMDARLDYDITAYHTIISDMLVADTEIDLYVNAGEVRVQGIESAIGYAISDRWRFDIAYTFADNKYVDFVSADVDYSGNTLSASPQHHLNARVTWTPIQDFSAELEWNRISSYYTSSGNDDPQGQAERPDLFNLRLAYQFGPWKLWGHVLNLLDTKYAERVSYSSTDGREYVVGEPINFYMGLSYTFK